MLVAANMRIAARPLLIGFLLVAVDVVVGRQSLATGIARLATGVLVRLLTFDMQHLATTLEGALGNGAHASLGAAVHHLRRRPRGGVNLRLRVACVAHTLGLRLHRRSRGLGMLRHWQKSPWRLRASPLGLHAVQRGVTSKGQGVVDNGTATHW